MRRRFFLPVLIALLLSGCAAMRPEAPEVQLVGLTVSDLSLTHANFQSELSLYNPNGAALEIEGLEFAFFLDDVLIARGASSKAFTIATEQTGSATLRLSTSFLNLFRLTQKLKGRSEIPFRVAGEVRIGGPGFLWVTVPVDSKGTIPLAGAIGEIFSAPDNFWRQPGRLVPENPPLEKDPPTPPSPPGDDATRKTGGVV